MCILSLLGKIQSVPHNLQVVCTFLCSVMSSEDSNTILQSLTLHVLWIVLMCLCRAWAELNILLHSGHSLGLDECVSGCSVLMCFLSCSSSLNVILHRGHDCCEILMASNFSETFSMSVSPFSFLSVLKSTSLMSILDHLWKRIIVQIVTNVQNLIFVNSFELLTENPRVGWASPHPDPRSPSCGGASGRPRT